MATALITGGTSGIGAEFARQLAERGYDLVLVARNPERLEMSSEQLHSRFGINVETMAADLADRADASRVAERIEDPLRTIDVVINNAGIGVHTKLTATDVAAHEHAFDVMCRAVLIIGAAAGRAMRARGSGRIINISSLQSLLTTGSYSAMKAWVTAYSQSLSVELAGTGVTVTAVLPGWVSTEWHARAGVKTSSIPDWLWTTPESVARIALRDSERGKVLSIPTGRYKAIGVVLRHLPRGSVRLISRKISQRRREDPAESPVSTTSPSSHSKDS